MTALPSDTHLRMRHSSTYNKGSSTQLSMGYAEGGALSCRAERIAMQLGLLVVSMTSHLQPVTWVSLVFPTSQIFTL